MSAQSLLDQLLKSGLGALGGLGEAAGQAQAGARNAMAHGEWQKYATGAAAGGALALLLGSRSGRKLGGQALKIGSVAAIGALAWKAWQNHQARQAGSTAAPASTAAAPVPFERLPAPQQEQHAQAMLAALIAAAKSDGHLDERERGLLDAELQRIEADPQTRSWVDHELRQPIDPAAVAARVSSPEMGAEIYLASLIVVDRQTPMERAYLDQLATQLKLPAALKADLEAQAST